MTEPPCYVESAAFASGWSAFAAARLLARHAAEIAELRADLREPLEDFVAALRLAGAAWAATACGSSEAVPAEAPVRSTYEPDELSTAEAGDVLQVSPRRVRQLLADGRLAGRRCGGRWRIDRGSVAAYRTRGET